MVNGRAISACCVVVLLCTATLAAAGSNVADAAMKADKAAVRALLEQKADVNAPQPDGATALHWAVWLDDVEMTAILVRAGANANAANRQGSTPLSLASINGNAAIIGELLKAGVNPNAPLSPYGDTALMMASRTGKADYLTRYYTMKINEPKYVGGYFWWYARQDMVPYTKALWSTLNSAILATP